MLHDVICATLHNAIQALRYMQKVLGMLKTLQYRSFVIDISFNFLCNTLFYWLKNWDDFVSPEKNLSVTYNAQTSQNTQAS
jgi:hypothetical protein